MAHKAPARAPLTAADFGRNGEAIVATLRTVARFEAVDLGRLAAAQRTGDGVAFFEAWHAVHEAATGADILTFQRSISAAYGAVDRRIRDLRLDRVLPERELALTRKAVAGRILALYAGPDTDAEILKTLSRAWTATRG